jgi:hypothetical protein
MPSSAAEPSTATHHHHDGAECCCAEWWALCSRSVQDILAARTSATGDDEVLVVWKPRWVPVSCLKNGPGIRRYQNAIKWKFTSAVCGMRVILPVVPGTSLAEDHAVKQAMAYAAKCQHRHDGAQLHAQRPRPSGPRKALGSDAKRQPQRTTKQPKLSQGSSAST